jgi:cytochrome P450 family 6
MFSAMLFLLLISFMWFVWYLNLRAYNFWKVRGIAYVPAEKINSKRFLNSVLLSHRTLKNVYEAHKTELCCGFFQLRSPVLMIRSAELVDRILNRDFKYFSDKRSSDCINPEKDPLTQHLIGLNGHKWRYLRAKLSPTFTSGKLKAMFPLLHESVDVFLAKIDSSNGSPIDIKELCGKLSADIIVSYAFGIKIDSLNGGGEQFLNMGKQAFGGDYWQMIKAHFRLLFPRLFKLFGFRGFSKDTTKFFCSFVKKSMDYRQKHNIHRYDFLHLLMKIQKEDSNSTKVKYDLGNNFKNK